MAEILFKKQQIETEQGESVLDALLRNDIDVSYSCKAGICQVCMMRCIEGSVPDESQQGLSPAQVKQNYFLACQCKPDQTIEIIEPGQVENSYIATLVDKKELSTGVFSLHLKTEKSFGYLPGQFVNLKRADGLMRSYSLASLPAEDDTLELHIRRMPGGEMSNWLFDSFSVGEAIEIDGPIGDCVYDDSMSDQPLLLIGSGTGLAPLLGVLRDALQHSHKQPIHLYHGAFNKEELYRDAALKALCESNENLFYKGCVTEKMTAEQVEKGLACEIAMADNPDLKGWQVFVCGAPSLVKTMQQKAFLAGAAMSDIHSDPFETKDLRKK